MQELCLLSPAHARTALLEEVIWFPPRTIPLGQLYSNKSHRASGRNYYRIAHPKRVATAQAGLFLADMALWMVATHVCDCAGRRLGDELTS